MTTYQAEQSYKTQGLAGNTIMNINEDVEAKTRKILLIEDEADIVDYVTIYCEAEGYQVSSVNDGTHALAKFRNEQPDLVLLDLMLPGLDGLEVCRRIRSISNIPIIMVTARRDEVDKLLGLETGADDYITKPFSPRELMARIRAIFRRLDNMVLEKSLEREVTPAPAETKRLKVGRLVVDLFTREVIFEGRAITGITNKEYELLVKLAQYPGRVYSKGELEESLYGYDSMLESRSIGVHISNLRNKLPNPKLIETVYGIGYKLARELS